MTTYENIDMYNYVSNVSIHSIQTIQIDILFFVSVFLVKIMTLAVMNFMVRGSGQNESTTSRGDVDETGCAGRESLSAFSMPRKRVIWQTVGCTGNSRIFILSGFSFLDG